MITHPAALPRIRLAFPRVGRTRRALRTLLVMAVLATLLLQSISLICGPWHGQLAAPASGAGDAQSVIAPHEPDDADPCCTGLEAPGDASLITLASTAPFGSGSLALAAAFFFLAGVVVPARSALPVTASPPRIRRYPARSSRILR
jgi:hypothetical protein